MNNTLKKKKKLNGVGGGNETNMVAMKRIKSGALSSSNPHVIYYIWKPVYTLEGVTLFFLPNVQLIGTINLKILAKK